MRYILDAGHGGMAWGRYLSKGKRSPDVPPGIFEGEFNRAICREVVYLLLKADTKALELCPGPVNTPLARGRRQKRNTLTTRVDAVNELCRYHKDIVLLSIHANASGNKWDPKAWGVKAFLPTDRKQSTARIRDIEYKLADDLVTRLSKYTKDRGIAKKGFTLVQRVRCPAVLLEVDFMTHPERAKKLADKTFRSLISQEIATTLLGLQRRV